MQKIIKIIVYICIPIIFVGILFVVRTKDRKTDIPVHIVREVPILGKAGSAHRHSTLLLFINGEAFNFFEEKYMLKDNKMHFEDDDGSVVHSHATGATLPYFLSTIGFSLTDDCISIPTGRQYCSSSITGNKLSIIINGVEIDGIDYYELQQNDKILINYGDDDDLMLRLKFNSVPSVPSEFQ